MTAWGFRCGRGSLIPGALAVTPTRRCAMPGLHRPSHHSPRHLNPKDSVLVRVDALETAAPRPVDTATAPPKVAPPPHRGAV